MKWFLGAIGALLLISSGAQAQGLSGPSGCLPASLCSVGNLTVTATTVPTVGVYSSGSNQLAFSTTSTRRAFFDSAGALNSAASTGYQFPSVTPSSTVPNLITNHTDTTSGVGGAVNHIALIAQGVGVLDASASGLLTGGAIPVVTGTGTPTIVTGSTDTSGEVTGGTLAISIVISFSSTKTNAPFCTVTPQTQVAAFAYTISTTAITISLTATTGEKIDYVCFQH